MWTRNYKKGKREGGKERGLGRKEEKKEGIGEKQKERQRECKSHDQFKLHYFKNLCVLNIMEGREMLLFDNIDKE